MASYQSDTYQNLPNAALAFTMYTTTFGNGDFLITPPNPGEIQLGYPTIPYLSLEAVIYQQMSSNPQVSATQLQSGRTSGQQSVQGQFTINDGTGTSRMVMGYSPGAF